MSIVKTNKRERRHKKIKAKIQGADKRPRLSVYRSNRVLHVQLINDSEGTTISGFRSDAVEGATPIERSFNAGLKIAEVAKKAGIEQVVFDRGGFMYAGQVKSLADGARKGGLEF